MVARRRLPGFVATPVFSKGKIEEEERPPEHGEHGGHGLLDSGCRLPAVYGMILSTKMRAGEWCMVDVRTGFPPNFPYIQQMESQPNNFETASRGVSTRQRSVILFGVNFRLWSYECLTVVFR